MIGVHTSDFLRPFAHEFFELFKTPWEFYSVGRSYEALICCGVEPTNYAAQLVLIYCGNQTDDNEQVFRSATAAMFLPFEKHRIPIYTNSRSLRSVTLEVEEDDVVAAESGTTVIRLGYNLFLEIGFLLTVGQPAEYAATPVLDLHISFLRHLLIRHTQYLIEVPARPAGYTMMTCLTHDVDHPSIRTASLHTLFGFLYRATVGSIVDTVRGRKKVSELATNLKAAFLFPLVYAGFGKDTWDTFARYAEIEKTRASTYFFIPRKGYAGEDPAGVKHRKRAAAYAASELLTSITALQSGGAEIGVHGIDAWRDTSKAAQERKSISELTGDREIGIRMHWLYCNRQTPANLERAGYVYDSTVGYNNTVGFRAGTVQIFKPVGVLSLLELPLHIMDTALFYRDYLDLKPRQAKRLISQMISQTQRFGGVLTINWHDRSLAPERLWGGVYQDAIEQLSDADAWFATCRDAVGWFRQRRSVVFESIGVNADNTLCISVRRDNEQRNIPAARLRIHRGRSARLNDHDAGYLDLELRESSQHFQVPMRFGEFNQVCA